MEKYSVHTHSKIVITITTMVLIIIHTELITAPTLIINTPHLLGASQRKGSLCCLIKFLTKINNSSNKLNSTAISVIILIRTFLKELRLAETARKMRELLHLQRNHQILHF